MAFPFSRDTTCMVITIDGPAGAGKSSTARELATRLGFHFLDTGAMYRAVALAAMQRGIPWDDSGELADLVRSLEIEVSDDRVYTDGVDVTEEIRKIEVTSVIHYVADNPEIRSHLVEQHAPRRSLRRLRHGRSRPGDRGFSQGGMQNIPDGQCRRAGETTYEGTRRSRRRT